MNLTIEQMRKIVDGAPDWAKSWDGLFYTSDYMQGAVRISDLRAALADHDRTDYVTDIRNHISPMTIVQGDL